MIGLLEHLTLTWHESISVQSRLTGPTTMSPIELSCDYESQSSRNRRIPLFRPKAADQAFFQRSVLPLGTQNQPVVSLMMLEVPLCGITFKWLGGGDFCLFISQVQITGPLMIGSWLHVTSVEHSMPLCCLIKNKKLMSAVLHFVWGLKSRLLFITTLLGKISNLKPYWFKITQTLKNT